jgi:hypothetical protein
MVALVIALSACASLDDTLAENAARQTLTPIVDELRSMPGVREVSMTTNNFMFDWTPHADIRVVFDADSQYSDWSAAGDVIYAGTSDPGLDGVMVSALLTVSGVADVDYLVGATPSLDARLHEIEDAVAIRSLGIPVTLYVGASLDGYDRMFIGPDDDGASTRTLLANAGEVAAITSESDADVTWFDFHGLLATGSLPTGSALAALIEMADLGPLVSLQVRQDPSGEGGYLDWNVERGGDFEYYTHEKGALSTLSSWSTVVAGARAVLEAKDPQLGYSFNRMSSPVEMRIGPCPGDREMTEADLEFAEALGTAGLVVPPELVGDCIPA